MGNTSLFVMFPFWSPLLAPKVICERDECLEFIQGLVGRPTLLVLE